MSRFSAGRDQARWIGTLVLVGGAYVATGQLGIRYAFAQPTAAPVWFPHGIALAALLLLGYRVWPAIFLGAFLLNVMVAGAFWASLGIAIGNTLSAMFGAYLVTRYANEADLFEHPRGVAAFVAFGVVLSTAIGATIGTTSVVLDRHAPWSTYESFWRSWWLGHATGTLIVAPLVLLWNRGPRVRWTTPAVLERSLFLLALAGVSGIVYGGGWPHAYMTVPFAFWAAVRFETREAASVTAILVLEAAWATTRGLGPFVGATPSVSFLGLQVFMGVLACVSLFLAALVAERRRLYEGAERAADRANRLRDVTLETLQGIVGSAVSASDLSALLEATMDLTLKALGCSLGAIWVGATYVVRGLPQQAGSLLAGVTSPHTPAQPEAVDQWHASTGGDPGALSALVRPYGVRASLVAPIRSTGRDVGGVALFDTTPRRWAPEEVSLAQAIGTQIGGAVEWLQLTHETQRRTVELDAFYDLSRRLRQAQAATDMHPMIVEHALQLLSADHGVLSLVDDGGEILTRVHTIGVQVPPTGSTIPVRETRAGRVVATGTTFVTEDVQGEPRHPAMEPEEYAALGPLVIVALRSEDQIIGTLRLARLKGRTPFSRVEVRLLEAIAELAGTALRRALLHRHLEQAYVDMVLALARAVDARDSTTADHSERIASYAVATARELGCTESEVQTVHWAALLHDIGKLGVPDTILRKPGQLSATEWVVMRQHPIIGAEILRAAHRMQEVAALVRHHQERWDGTGYPDGLQGETIPLGARILAVADTFGAMTEDRIYGRGRSVEEAVAELRRCAGTQLDPRVVHGFCTVLHARRDRTDGVMSSSLHIRRPIAVLSRSRPVSLSRRGGRAVPAMSDLAHALLRPLDLPAVLDEILTQIQEVFGYPICHIWFFDEATGELHLKAHRGAEPTAADAGHHRVGEQAIVEWVARHGQAHYAPSVNGPPLPEAGTARSQAAYPLMVQGRVIGVLGVESPETDAFPDAVRDVLSAFANLAALGIVRAERDSELSRLALTDGLTELANHRALWDALERDVARAHRTGEPVSVVMVEIDRFKLINDRFGHLQGDAVLRSVADVLKQQSRAMDLPSRAGGDEFVLVLPGTAKDAARVIAERIRTHAERIALPDGPSLSVSVGVAAAPGDGGTANALLEAADRAMYVAKHGGGNRVTVA